MKTLKEVLESGKKILGANKRIVFRDKDDNYCVRIAVRLDDISSEPYTFDFMLIEAEYTRKASDFFVKKLVGYSWEEVVAHKNLNSKNYDWYVWHFDMLATILEVQKDV